MDARRRRDRTAVSVRATADAFGHRMGQALALENAAPGASEV
jgi:hypothetical protein